MRLATATVLKQGVRLINIDSGKVVPLRPGTEHDLDCITHKDREYYVIHNDRIGSTTTHFEMLERDGAIKLTRISDDGPRWDGVLLPITGSGQLTDHQRVNGVIGHLVKGRFLCERCTLNEGLTYPDAIAVRPINILPYSQDCHECGLLIFDVSRVKGQPKILFRKVMVVK